MEDSLDILISRLRDQKGKAFWQLLAEITRRREFHLVEERIFSAAGQADQDLGRRLEAARKAVTCGYTVYLLPNPQSIKSADFIFERKGVYRLYELKTITGKNSVGNRLKESSGQSNRVILHITSKYNPRKLAEEIKKYYNSDPLAEEVLIFYKRKRSYIRRDSVTADLWRTLMSLF